MLSCVLVCDRVGSCLFLLGIVCSCVCVFMFVHVARVCSYVVAVALSGACLRLLAFIHNCVLVFYRLLPCSCVRVCVFMVVRVRSCMSLCSSSCSCVC